MILLNKHQTARISALKNNKFEDVPQQRNRPFLWIERFNVMIVFS